MQYIVRIVDSYYVVLYVENKMKDQCCSENKSRNLISKPTILKIRKFYSNEGGGSGGKRCRKGKNDKKISTRVESMRLYDIKLVVYVYTLSYKALLSCSG